jgi:hypothetical protein
MDYKNKKQILECSHQWKKSILLYSTVEDCQLCNVKKEDWDSKLCKEVNNEKKQKIYEVDVYFDEYNHNIGFSQLVFDDIIRSAEVSEKQWEWAQTYDSRM